MNKTVLGPAIYLYDNVVDNCEEIISSALSRKDEWIDAHIIEDDRNVVQKSVRNNRSIDVAPTFHTGPEWFSLSRSIWLCVNNYANDMSVGFSVMENLQILHYQPTVGHYTTHTDSHPSNNRIISSVLYLNDVEEGGETYFDLFNISVAPKRGSMLVFPSNYAYCHQARPSLKNEKFVAVSWFRA